MLKRSFHQMQSQGQSSVSRRTSSQTNNNTARERSELPEESRSGCATPAQNWEPIPRKGSFDLDASIILIGVRGVGKSSLGVIAATAYSRRLIDSERAFFDATGVATQTYRKAHGTADYHKQHHRILKDTLDKHDKNCVIECSFSDLENRGALILREYAQSHPVIHISRDAEGIRSYLQVWTAERVSKLLEASGLILRSCSNFEFFNLSEKPNKDLSRVSNDSNSSTGSSLTLKNVERDFLMLLRNVIGDHDRGQSYHSAYPLSKIPVHDRDFTFSAVVDVAGILGNNIDLEELQIGADAVELRVDVGSLVTDRLTDPTIHFGPVAEAFATLRRATILPMIITVTRPGNDDSPKFKGKSLLDLTSYCFRLGPEYCTVDLSFQDAEISALMAAKGRTRVIASLHMQDAPPAGWNDSRCVAIYEQALRLDCDLVKITMPATSIKDNFTTQVFREKIAADKGGRPLICYNTGRNGKPSMYYNRVLSPVHSPQNQDPSKAAKSDCERVTAKDLFTALFATFVYEPMKFFIYGADVSYSLSPAMHNAAYSVCGMTHRYSAHSSSTLDDFKRLIRENDFGGASVVQPYKTGVLPLLDRLSSHATAIGSVNTILPIRKLPSKDSLPIDISLLSQANRHGPVQAFYGENTDWIGIRACLRRGLSPANTVRPQSTALVCGSGGQARSTVYSMLSLGMRNIFLCNRTVEHAHTLAEHYNKLIDNDAISELDPANAAHTQIRVIESFDAPWPSDFRYPSMIVSSIPTQNPDGSPTNFTLPETWLKNPTGGVVVELAYRPMMTPLVRQMRAQTHKGWILMNGFDILPEQAFAQFELFTGRRAPREVMRGEVIKQYEAEQGREELASSNLDPNMRGR